MNLEYRLIKGDCLKALPIIPSDSIDLGITDPPWGYRSYGQFPKRNISEFSSMPDEHILEVFKECYRVLKPKKHFYFFTSNLRLDIDIPLALKAGFKYQQLLVLPSSMGLGYGYRHSFLPIVFMSKNGTSTTKFHNVCNVLPKPKERFNSFKKPVETVELLIGQSSNEGDLVIDPFVGGGTTLVAAMNKKRSCIGIEISLEHCDEIQKRIPNLIVSQI